MISTKLSILFCVVLLYVIAFLGCALMQPTVMKRSIPSTRRSKGHAAAVPSTEMPTFVISCYDNICDSKQLKLIQNAAKIRSHSFTSVFSTVSEPRSALEAFILNLLDNLDGDVGSSGQYVEYWYRHAGHKTIRMLEAHRDIDEVYAAKNQIPSSLGSDIKFGCQRYPTYGHVVYLNVKGNVLAPTLVYEEEMPQSNIVGAPGHMTALWSIPSVSNRFLRFPGDAMHAVNYPPFGFLNSKDASDCTSQDYQCDAESERSVLLFNVWKDPPLHPPVEEPLSNQEYQYWSDLCAPIEKIEKPLLCKPIQHWTHVSNEILDCNDRDGQRDDNSLSELNVPLLGNISRRACLEDRLHHKVIHEDVIQAFGSKDCLYRVPLF